MSKLEQLIQELCPDGVEYKSLGKLGSFYGGLTGKSKKDFENGNSKFITYMNVFNNLSINTDVTERVFIGENEKQNTLQYGDVVFTGSSETPEECGMSSVLTVKTDEKLYLNSFCFVFRFNEPDTMEPGFSKYLFRSLELRKQIKKTASGVTRFNVSKEKMKRVRVPLVPLPIQREIVHILDNFTLLSAELSAELSARKQQYAYYRDYLLDFSLDEDIEHIKSISNNVEFLKISDVSNIKRGVRVVKNQLSQDNNLYPVYQNSLVPLGFFDKFNCNKDTAFVIGAGAAGQVGYSNVDFWAADDCYYFDCSDKLNSRYLYYVLISNQSYLDSRVRKASIPRISRESIERLTIPVPPLDEQKRIVSILDRFDKLCNDISIGLPAEIEKRKQQYEYYRDAILSFDCSQIVKVERERANTQ